MRESLKLIWIMLAELIATNQNYSKSLEEKLGKLYTLIEEEIK